VPDSQDSIEEKIGDMMGMNQDKTITGEPWVEFQTRKPGFKDDKLCSDTCFWLKGNRPAIASAWSKEEISRFKTILPAYKDDKRGACMLALCVGKPCSEVRRLAKLSTFN
jgi:hypothetical protein